MRFITFLSVLFLSLVGYAQDLPGYYINTLGERTEVFFKKTYFADVESLEFRIQEGDEYKKLNPNDLTEYGIGEEYKFVKRTVQIDNSYSLSDRRLSNQKAPQWETRVIFLNVLAEGDATLYSYMDDEETKFFYTVKNKVNEPTQLVNRRYVSGNQILMNSSFKQDLYLNVSCEGTVSDDFKNVSYSQNSLINVFEKFNECKGSTHKVYSNKGGNESKIKFSVFAGANMSSFHLKHNGNSDSESQVTPGLGAEAMLLFASGKWGVFARIEFETIKGTVTETFNPGFTLITDEYTLDAKYINLVAGPRYFITSRLYADVAAGVHLGFGDLTYRKLIEAGGTQSVSVDEGHSLAMNFFATLGVGFSITENWAVEVKYDLPRGVLSKEIGPDITTQRMGAVVKYTFN